MAAVAPSIVLVNIRGHWSMGFGLLNILLLFTLFLFVFGRLFGGVALHKVVGKYHSLVA